MWATFSPHNVSIQIAPPGDRHRLTSSYEVKQSLAGTPEPLNDISLLVKSSAQ